MNLYLDPGRVSGLPEAERALLAELVKIYARHQPKNDKKERYYQGSIPLGAVNLGIALPRGVLGLEIGCAWGAKCVDVLAERSLFDGFVDENGSGIQLLDSIVRGNRLVQQYAKACRDELKFGCTFATLSRDPALGCRIRFHTPRSAAARWNGAKGRIDGGFAVIHAPADPNSGEVKPQLINLYTETAIWTLQRLPSDLWTATEHPHALGRPLMEPLIYSATSDRPLGRSRIKEPVRRLIDGYVRTVANATIGLEFSTAPQKYLLGVSDEQFDAIVNNKFRTYVGSVLAATTDPSSGEKPSFGQLPQGNIEPHVQMLRMLSTQFSAATGLSVSDTGVVNDANPTSSDAIAAQTVTLVGMAEHLNAANGAALYTIAQMALAIAQNTTPDKLPPEQQAVMAHFKNPARPNVAATADAATKIAGARPAFAETDVFLEMLGFDPAEVRRIKAQETRARGLRLLNEEFSDENAVE